jgi:response regulator RpfG family c-di-GMP phosphodiesterase
MTSERIMIADDEPIILDLYRLQLEEEFQIDTAEGGRQALALLAERGPYAVVVADMHMPSMSGTELLRSVQELHPKAVRIMLTGDDQQNVAVDAVNEGQVFRFLNKPCPADRLAKALRAGLEQHRLLMAEKELLDDTLKGSIKLLMEILSIINPPAFGRASRVCRLVQKLCERMAVGNSWEISVAATLSQIGCVSLPDSVLEKLQRGETLTLAETKLYKSHPQLGCSLVAKIPRLERVAQIIALQQVPQDFEKLTGHDPQRLEVAQHAGILKAALDYDSLIEQGVSPDSAIREMFNRPATYEPRVLRSLAELVPETRGQCVRHVPLAQLQDGMVLGGHLTDTSGLVLVANGQVITAWLLERLRNREHTYGSKVKEPICILQAERPTDELQETSPVELHTSLSAN